MTGARAADSKAPAEPGKVSLKMWFCLRDLKRPNAKVKAYQQLEAEGFRVFTPMRESVVNSRGKKIRIRRPIISDLLFVDSDRKALDPVVEKTPTLQYRYVKGGAYQEAMTVGEQTMNNFIEASAHGEAIRYLLPEEIEKGQVGKPVKIIGGPLDGIVGRLMGIRGKKTRRLLVELPGIVALTLDVAPDLLSIEPGE